MRTSAVAVAALLSCLLWPRAGRADNPSALARSVAHHHYAFGRLRIPRRAAGLMRGLGLGRWVKSRQVLHVDASGFEAFAKATGRDYLEVLIPENTGHVYYRYGDKVYDFYPEGFRVRGLRAPGKSDRYGVLIKLDAVQRQKVESYLARLEKSAGAELGDYDFHGTNGFHCVSWLERLQLGDKPGETITKLLGGKNGDGMVRFSHFLLERAAGVEATVVYSNRTLEKRTLEKLAPNLMTERGLRAAHAAGRWY